MQYRNLGKTELTISELCMGSMQFGWTADEKMAYKVLSAAFEAGINFIDTADIYSNWVEGNPGGVSESIIGKWLAKSGIPRHKLVIATKVRGLMKVAPNGEGLSHEHIIKSVEASLRRLQTDHIDLYQAHWFDENVPIYETLSAFDALVKDGKVRYVGCSNYPTWRLMRALWTSDSEKLVRYDSLQPHYNLVYRAEFERELADVCREYKIGVIPYSPLAGGFLTGKYKKGQELPPNSRGADSSRIQGYMTDKNWDLLEKMADIGKKNGRRTVSQVALAWLLANPVVTSPIIGPKNLKQLEDNLGAVDFQLSAEDKESLDLASDWR